tara:strand:+ start:347 stop:655 length:309 start_codon:yes stop_codon:yes gene_type:complete
MKYLKIFTLLFLTLFIFSCGSLREGFVNQKKTSSDEFLVEKKSPLVMPPDYSDLPVPKKEDVKVSESNIIKELVTDDNNENGETRKIDITFEESLLKKIKNN